MCGLMISGEAHGPEKTTTCQLHMRSFRDGETITVEPWRADAFPIIRDLVVDRSAFDRIIQAGGFISVNTGAAPRPTPARCRSRKADRAFMAAEVHRLRCVRRRLPQRQRHALHGRQGDPPRRASAGAAGALGPRVQAMVSQHDHEPVSAAAPISVSARDACPKGIPLDVISQLNKDLLGAMRARG
jgi:succinate dehydrogenase / fumarate reductase iron-sulfur subunit